MVGKENKVVFSGRKGNETVISMLEQNTYANSYDTSPLLNYRVLVAWAFVLDHVGNVCLGENTTTLCIILPFCYNCFSQSFTSPAFCEYM